MGQTTYLVSPEGGRSTNHSCLVDGERSSLRLDRSPSTMKILAKRRTRFAITEKVSQQYQNNVSQNETRWSYFSLILLGKGSRTPSLDLLPGCLASLITCSLIPLGSFVCILISTPARQQKHGC
jgi:hypothetical protein